jgi:hypothetical protein
MNKTERFQACILARLYPFPLAKAIQEDKAAARRRRQQQGIERPVEP